MFVTENKIIPFPHKTILEDLLSRYGEADSYSYTPWEGCKSEFDKRLSKEDNVTIADVIAGVPDYSFRKSRANDDGIRREEAACEVSEYYSRLEDISQDFPHRYISNIIEGFKRNHNGLSRKRYDEMSFDLYFDDEDGTYIDPTDEVEEVRDFSTEEIVDAKRKLPYLLKQLHSGSKMYGGSLLSFIIAYEKCANRGKTAPRDIVAAGVYKVNVDGSIGVKFTIEENSGTKLPALRKWVMGGFPKDMYYKAYKDLLQCCAVLSVDITEEDPTVYNNEFISKAVCTYLASNEEFIETYGIMGERKILNMLEPDKLFKAARRIAGDDSLDLSIDVMMLCENIASNTEHLKFKFIERWREKPKLVLQFIEEYSKRNKISSMKREVIDSYKGIIKLRTGDFFLVDIKEITDDLNDRLALISSSGHLIKAKPFEFEIEVLELGQVLQFYKRGGVCEWESVCI